jgi:CRP-like cAMP-binding protein
MLGRTPANGSGERAMRGRHANRKFTDRLRTTRLFGECSTNELRLAASLLTELDIPAGRVLMRQGQMGHECFVIMNGHAVVERDGSIVANVTSGSLVGELALMGAPTRTASVTAASDMEVVVMSRTEFATLRALGIGAVDRALTSIAAERRRALERVRVPAMPTQPPVAASA